MKSLYITSVDQYSGKTALCLALGRIYQEKGLEVGYLKPFSLRPGRSEIKLPTKMLRLSLINYPLTPSPGISARW